MSLRWRGHAMAAIAGLALITAHAALLPTLLDRFARPPLEVMLDQAAADNLAAAVPPDLRRRVTVLVDGRPGNTLPSTPGMHRIEWRMQYRGGFDHRAGHTRLVGPFQDPAAPPCALRLLVGQALLGADSGHYPGDTAGVPRAAHPPSRANTISATSPMPGTLGHVLASALTAELAGFEQWPLGRFRRITDMGMRWIAAADLAPTLRRRMDREAGTAITGILRVALTLRFDSGSVPLWIAVAPRIAGDSLHLATYLDARLKLDRSMYQWVSDLVGGDEIAARTARGQLDGALNDVLAAPPPIPLDHGASLRVAYCPDQPIDIVSGQYAAVPMYVVGAPAAVQPVLLGPASRPVVDMRSPLMLELELDAINGLLHTLWHSRVLDRALIDTAARFHANQLVQELLTVRLRDVHVALPPTVEPWPDSWPERLVLPERPVPPARQKPHAGHHPGPQPEFQLGVDAALIIQDGPTATPARLFGTVGFALRDPGRPELLAELTLSDLALTCEPAPGKLAPCYADLVAALRDRAGDIHGELSRRFTALLSNLLLERRISLEDASFHIERITTQSQVSHPSGLIRIELFGRLDQP